jgi:hypothetical protein
MQSRLHFTGNGYAGQLLNMIRNGKSAFTLMSVYDFMVLKFQIQNLGGVIANGNQLTITSGKISFITTISSTNRLANGNMEFTDRYTTQIYLLSNGPQENQYLVTENNELLLV